jgi:hypothetical protein
MLDIMELKESIVNLINQTKDQVTCKYNIPYEKVDDNNTSYS